MRYEQKAELQDSNKARMYEEKKKQMSSEKLKKYKIYITWEAEVKAKNYNDAIIEGAEEWYIGHDHKDFKAEEIKDE